MDEELKKAKIDLDAVVALPLQTDELLMRLRSATLGGIYDSTGMRFCRDLLSEAADEIERLQAAKRRAMKIAAMRMTRL